MRNYWSIKLSFGREASFQKTIEKRGYHGYRVQEFMVFIQGKHNLKVQKNMAKHCSMQTIGLLFILLIICSFSRIKRFVLLAIPWEPWQSGTL
jgi:hypothetical protein